MNITEKIETIETTFDWQRKRMARKKQLQFKDLNKGTNIAEKQYQTFLSLMIKKNQ